MCPFTHLQYINLRMCTICVFTVHQFAHLHFINLCILREREEEEEEEEEEFTQDSNLFSAPFFCSSVFRE